MPKSYSKSLESHVKTSREVKISESLNRIPSKVESAQQHSSRQVLNKKSSMSVAGMKMREQAAKM